MDAKHGTQIQKHILVLNVVAVQLLRFPFLEGRTLETKCSF